MAWDIFISKGWFLFNVTYNINSQSTRLQVFIQEIVYFYVVNTSDIFIDSHVQPDSGMEHSISVNGPRELGCICSHS